MSQKRGSPKECERDRYWLVSGVVRKQTILYGVSLWCPQPITIVTPKNTDDSMVVLKGKGGGGEVAKWKGVK